MTYEEAIRRIKEFGLHHAIGDLPQSYYTVQAFEMAIEALKKQSEIVHCKDCKNWKTIIIEAPDGRRIEAGQCELAGWLCGEQGYCMRGREVE